MNENKEFRIGIDLGGTKIEIAAMDAAGTILHRTRVKTPRGDYTATLDIIRDLVATLEDKLGVRATVGIAIPGAVSPATGLVKNSNSTWLNGQNFDEDLKHVLQRPVKLSNDANCFALSEAVDGAGRDGHLVFGIIAGTGIGGGLVVGRSVWTGAHAIAGEWGHNPLPWPRPQELPGALCYCGKQGCIETWLSGPALARLYREAAGNALEAHEIIARAAGGEPLAITLLDAWFDRFARALATVVNLLDPDVVVLGGGLSNLDRLPAELSARLGSYVFSDRVSTPIRRAVHGDSSGVRGAAWLWSPTSS